jgi:hypothetical protein
METKQCEGTTDWMSKAEIIQLWNSLVFGKSVRTVGEVIRGEDGKRYEVCEGFSLELHTP